MQKKAGPKFRRAVWSTTRSNFYARHKLSSWSDANGIKLICAQMAYASLVFGGALNQSGSLFFFEEPAKAVIYLSK